MVVRWVVSCLGHITVMGMNDRADGSGDWSKKVKMEKKGGIWSSKDPGIQDNHEKGNQPKDVRVVLPNCGKRFETTCGTVIRK